jgi:hypothetical protein
VRNATESGGDSGGPVLINVDGKWTLAGLAHGLDGSIRDVLATRAGVSNRDCAGRHSPVRAYRSLRTGLLTPLAPRLVTLKSRTSKSRSDLGCCPTYGTSRIVQTDVDAL